MINQEKMKEILNADWYNAWKKARIKSYIMLGGALGSVFLGMTIIDKDMINAKSLVEMAAPLIASISMFFAACAIALSRGIERFAIGIMHNGLLLTIAETESIKELDQLRATVRTTINNEYKESRGYDTMRRNGIWVLQRINERKNDLLALDIELDKKIKPPRRPEHAFFRAQRIATCH